MATKTLEELLSGGTLPEIIARQTENTKSAAAIFDKKDATAEEIKSAVALDEETEKLQVKRVELEGIEAAKARNTKRMADINTPANRPQFNGGNGGDDATKNALVEMPFASSLKNFRVGVGGIKTVQEAETKALRFGYFIAASLYRNAKAIEWCKANNVEIKVQQEATPQDGGVLVPVEFERTLIDLREEYGVFRPNAKNVPMGSETKLIPRRTGGLTAYFIGEGQPGTQSSKTWDNVQLVAKKLMVLVVYSSEIAEDAIINLADDLAGEIAYAFAQKEDACGFLGDGTSTYGGIVGVIPRLLGLSATIADIAGIQVQTGTASFSGVILADFQNTIAKLPKYADTQRAKWYMHKSFYHSIPAVLLTAAGGNTISDIQGGVRKPMFLGYPVEFAQILPTVWVANQIFALFGDLSLAASFGDRRSTTLFTDPYSLTASDQTQIRGTERFDINVHDVGNASATASLRVPGPIVALASAGS